MTSKQNILLNHTTPFNFQARILSLFPEIESDETFSLLNLFVDQYLNLTQYPSLLSWPDYRFPAHIMLKAVLISYAHQGYKSLRKQEDFYKFDLRVRCLFQFGTPSYGTIHSFHQALLPCIEDIFVKFNQFIGELDPLLDPSVLFLDGTKIEANANKMTFVWTAATRKYFMSSWEKLIHLIEKLNGWLKNNHVSYRVTTLKKPDPQFLFYLDSFFVKLEDQFDVPIVTGRGHRKHPLQRLHDQFGDIAVRLFKYAVYEELAKGRNSFSKTDPDATFMHMKWDYYNHTNIFKPAYNVQFGVSSGYIRVVHVSQNCNDLHDFIPTVKKYHEQYNEYPKMVPADAGYGSFDNYTYCENHGIELMMKYSGQNKEGEAITDKNRFRSWAFERTDRGIPICPGGHKMELLRVKVSNKGLYPQEVSHYGCSHCQECPLRSKCTRSKYGRKVQICHDLERMKRTVKKNMSTDEGHQIMVSRSIQAEGWRYQRKL